MTEAKPLSAEEISSCRTLAWADDEKWTNANVRRLIATIEARDDQIKRLREMMDKQAEKLLGDRAVLQLAIHDALAFLEEEEANEIMSTIRHQLRCALAACGLVVRLSIASTAAIQMTSDDAWENERGALLEMIAGRDRTIERRDEQIKRLRRVLHHLSREIKADAGMTGHPLLHAIGPSNYRTLVDACLEADEALAATEQKP